MSICTTLAEAKGLSLVSRNGRFEPIGGWLTVYETTNLEKAWDMFELLTATRVILLMASYRLKIQIIWTKPPPKEKR